MAKRVHELAVYLRDRYDGDATRVWTDATSSDQLRANLLADQALARVPVVILSGVADVLHQGRALQAVEVLPKPFAIEKLYAVVDTYCPRVQS